MIRFKIKQIIQETPDTRTFVFDVPPYSWDYEAGQYVTLTLNIGGKRIFRSYSLATSPYHDALPAITVKRMEHGLVSSYLHEHVRVGTELTSSLPRGKFTIDYKPSKVRKHVFLAAGSGIVPLYSMLRAVLHQEPCSEATLIYINRHQDAIIYARSIDALQKRYEHRLAVTHVLTQPKPGWGGRSGRLSTKDLHAMLQDKIEAHYWLCAPEGFMDVVYSSLVLAGVDESRIHKENFTRLCEPTNDRIGVDAEVTVHHRGEVQVVKVAQGEKLLDALLDAEIEVPFSCCSGICNTCRVKCMDGQVHMLSEEGLTQKDKEQKYVLSCVSYPTTAKLTIDLDD